jgi:hypothetical protein
MGKKTLVINTSGNVGKTTIAKHVIASFQNDAPVLCVETQNAKPSGVGNVTSIGASRFHDIFRALMSADDIVIDVGSSECQEFMAEVARFRSTLPEFDLFVVPVIPTEKQQTDTISTIAWLLSLKVPANKIRVVFNLYAPRSGQTIETTFPLLTGWLDEASGVSWKPALVVYKNDIFAMLETVGASILELAGDKTDFRAARAKAKGDGAKLSDVMDRQFAVDLAVSAKENLEAVYRALYPGGAIKPEAKAA